MPTKATTKKQKTDESTPLPQPQWAQELSIKYQSAITHAFLLHGNVEDYVGGVAGLSLKNYLISSFGEREIVVSWNRASGFYLPTPEMRQRFAEIVEFPIPGGSPQTPTARSGFAAGLNQMAAGAPTDLAKALGKVRQPSDALDYLNRLLHARTSKPVRAAVLIDYAESIAPQADAAGAENDRAALVTLSEWGRDVAGIGERGGHLIILIANDLHDLNERLRKSAVRYEQIEIPLPTFEERRDFAHGLIESDSVKMAESFTYEDMARMTTGLRFIDIEDIVLRASFHQTDVSRPLTRARKDEIVSAEFEEVLQIVDPERGFEALGGLVEVKEYLLEDVVSPMRAGRNRQCPMGIVFMGPAGTGKTQLAKALAKEAGVTFVELQPSKIFSKWVGDTERRLERALTAIRMMTPCIVFIDELDQAISRGESGDSGVSNRVFKRLMEVMADGTLRGRVLWICATNRPDLLDAAFRVGRIDKNIPVLAPGADERAAILEVLTMQAFGDTTEMPSVEEYQELAAKMEGYTGAEIEGIVGKATTLHAKHQDWSVIQALQEAFERIIPSTQDIQRMTHLALLHCNDLDLVPTAYRELARQLRHPATRAELLDEEPEEIHQRRSRKRDW